MTSTSATADRFADVLGGDLRHGNPGRMQPPAVSEQGVEATLTVRLRRIDVFPRYKDSYEKFRARHAVESAAIAALDRLLAAGWRVVRADAAATVFTAKATFVDDGDALTSALACGAHHDLGLDVDFSLVIDEERVALPKEPQV